MDINDEWQMFISSNDKDNNASYEPNRQEIDIEEVPTPTPIYISTKTKIAYITNKTSNLRINILSVFWDIPIISYTTPTNGIVKKQIMIKSSNEEELAKTQAKLLNIKHYEELIITSINNPEGRIKFKDKRKISIGISKKDITSFRCKKKSAFDNCFVLIMRLQIEETFKEYHIKVFNTGKIEIPGVKDDGIFNMIMENLVTLLNANIEDELSFKTDDNMEVLINSNFNCGFYIKRDVLYKLLKYDYNIPTIYDPCMYPGIQCKYNYETKNENGSISNKKVSFMIFRTGSVLIMGKCKEHVLHDMYDFVSKILIDQYTNISQGNHNKEELQEEEEEDLEQEELNEKIKPKTKAKKHKKKIIFLETTTSH